VRAALEALAEVRAPEQFTHNLAALGGAHKTVRLDQATGADAINRIVRDAGGNISSGPDPIVQMKAVKNASEIAGARAAHVRDGVAVSGFLAWFEREAPHGKLTEIDAVEALEDFRRKTGVLKDISFPTIAGSGPHGAIVHYRVTRKSNRHISPGEIFLIDSGAQYEDGTTDITRTVIVGEPTARCVIALPASSRATSRLHPVFPRARPAPNSTASRARHCGPPGSISTTAPVRVGSYLSVHEGRRVFPRSAPRCSSAA
jgi:Xaa-Pro aminopeptidase